MYSLSIHILPIIHILPVNPNTTCQSIYSLSSKYSRSIHILPVNPYTPCQSIYSLSIYFLSIYSLSLYSLSIYSLSINILPVTMKSHLFLIITPLIKGVLKRISNVKPDKFGFLVTRGPTRSQSNGA